MEEKNTFDLKSVKVYRTKEGTIFELAFAVVAIVVWALVIWLVQRAPDVVPTHFDALGNPNAWGSPAGILIPCVILTIAAVVIMVLAYFPRYINMPFKIRNIRQVELSLRQLRILGITFMLMPLAVAYTSLGMKTPTPAPMIAVIGAMLLEILVTSILIYRTK